MREDGRDGIAAKLGAGTRVAYRAVRKVSLPLLKDRILERDIRAVRTIVADVPRVDASRSPANFDAP